jgi:hypothetical protein
MDSRIYPANIGGIKTRYVDGVLTFYNGSGVAFQKINPTGVVACGTLAVPIASAVANVYFRENYFKATSASGWPCGDYTHMSAAGVGGSFTALEGDMTVDAAVSDATGVECFMDFASGAGKVSGHAAAGQFTIDYADAALPGSAGGCYMAGRFNIKGEGSSCDPTKAQRMSCIELQTQGTFKTSCDFEKLPQSYAIYFNGFTGASGVNQILSTTRLAELPTSTVGIRVGVGADGATGTAYYIPLVLATEWN